MRRFIPILIASLIPLVPFPCFAQSNSTESLTISTYYPSPYGVYRNLRLNPSQEPAMGLGAGLIYYNETEDNLKLYTNSAPGHWVTVAGGSNGQFWSGNADGSIVYLSNSTGNVGIGTTSPTSPLTIHGGTLGTAAGNALLLQELDSSAVGNNQFLRFFAKRSAAGNTWNTADLYLQRRVDGTDMGFIKWGGGPDKGIEFGSGTTEFMRMTDDGNFSIGGGTAPVYKLVVGGDIRGTGDVIATGDIRGSAFYYSSDRSLKKNIRPLNSSLDKIARLQGVSFQWKGDGRPDIGLVAQDVEKVYPELVKSDKNSGLRSVEYGNLVAVLVEAVKEQQQQIQALKKEITDLKNKN